jgi:cell division protein FtsW (lipid II flippase)
MLIPVLVLCAAGILCMQAIAPDDQEGELSAQAFNQLRYMVIAVGVMSVVMIVGYHRLGRWSYLLFALCVLLLLYLALDRWFDSLPLVREIRNARRWIRLGPFLFQPSEVTKIVYVLALAWYLRYRRNYRTFMGLAYPFGITLVPMALILLQPDLGTVLLFLPVLFAMLFAAGARIKHLLIIILLGLACIPFFWMKIADYQRLRITGVLLQSENLRDYLAEPPSWLEGRPTRWDWLRPAGTDRREWRRELVGWEDRSGFQLVSSKTAIGSGRITGQGFGEGIFIDYSFLPERHNDFIYALIAHQWGLLGSLGILFCYGLIVLTGIVIASMTEDPFGRLVAVGISVMLAVQTLTNLAMTVGLGPITGVTLPFISAGGSSLVASFISIGLLISVSQRRPVMIAHPPFEFDEEDE